MRIKEGVLPKTFADTIDFSRNVIIDMRYNNVRYRYEYNPNKKYLNWGYNDNSSLLVAVYGRTSYKSIVSAIYGYRSAGLWPIFHSTNDLINLLNDLEQKGVKITIS